MREAKSVLELSKCRTELSSADVWQESDEAQAALMVSLAFLEVLLPTSQLRSPARISLKVIAYPDDDADLECESLPDRARQAALAHSGHDRAFTHRRTPSPSEDVFRG